MRWIVIILDLQRFHTGNHGFSVYCTREMTRAVSSMPYEQDKRILSRMLMLDIN